MSDNRDIKTIRKKDLDIADTLRMYLEGDGEVSGPGGRLRGLECLAIAGVLSGTEDNFAVFHNDGAQVPEHHEVSGIQVTMSTMVKTPDGKK